MTNSTRTVHPLGWAKARGYAHGIIAQGRFLFVAGQIGWDPQPRSPKLPRGFADQFGRALDNVLCVVREAGGTPADLARMTIYVTSKKEYLASQKRIGEIWQRKVGRHYPAMTLVEVSALLEPGAKLELEATAVL